VGLGKAALLVVRWYKAGQSFRLFRENSMAFPIDPESVVAKERKLFLCQDPELRSRILPLFQFDPHRADDRPIGHGTTFRVDPWSRCLTAYHVLEDLFTLGDDARRLVLRPNIRLAALEVPFLAYGTPRLSPDSWRPIVESYTHVAIEERPLQRASLRNFCELIVLRIRPRQPSPTGSPYLPLDLNRWRPQNGETVLVS
jgi:hypothetical protein